MRKTQIVDAKCTSTTAPLLQRRRHIILRPNWRTCLVGLITRVDRRANQPKRFAKLVSRPHVSLRCFFFHEKTRAFVRKRGRIGFRHPFLQRPTVNTRSMAGHETVHPRLYFSCFYHHELSKAAEAAALGLRLNDKRSSLSAGIKTKDYCCHERA